MDEFELVMRMKSGDRSAFLLCGDRQDAEDNLQEAFVTCWVHRRELKKEESFRYWLFR